jgi:hypothetical protein
MLFPDADQAKQKIYKEIPNPKSMRDLKIDLVRLFNDEYMDDYTVAIFEMDKLPIVSFAHDVVGNFEGGDTSCYAVHSSVKAALLKHSCEHSEIEEGLVEEALHHFPLIVDLDERGEYKAHVENFKGETVYEIDGDWIVEAGYMRHKEDVDGLTEYLIDQGFIEENDKIILRK